MFNGLLTEEKYLPHIMGRRQFQVSTHEHKHMPSFATTLVCVSRTEQEHIAALQITFCNFLASVKNALPPSDE